MTAITFPSAITAARTVADCFKYRNKVGIDVAIEALKEYVRGSKGKMDELWEHAHEALRFLSGAMRSPPRISTHVLKLRDLPLKNLDGLLQLDAFWTRLNVALHSEE